jgi:hypothetical protein
VRVSAVSAFKWKNKINWESMGTEQSKNFYLLRKVNGGNQWIRKKKKTKVMRKKRRKVKICKNKKRVKKRRKKRRKDEKRGK